MNVFNGASVTGNGTININGAGSMLNASGTVGGGVRTIVLSNGGVLEGGHYDAATPTNSFGGLCKGA